VTGIRPGSLSEIPVRIQELYRDADLYRVIQENGKRYYEARFTPEAMADAYHRVFTSVASVRGQYICPAGEVA
jgi:hypothetical protein